MGDVFDFWFEYGHVIPKGFVRLQGKLAELTDRGIPVYLFTGNHDMWMFGYFEKELNIPLLREPQELIVEGKSFWIGHGDGLGPHDHLYKFLKKVFANKFFQWLFRITHPDLGISIANYWSRNSRGKGSKNEEAFLGKNEWLWIYCKEIEQKKHHDYYIFGHRHLPLDLPVGNSSRYINLGEWLTCFTYASYDGKNLELKKFEPEAL
jgi:UDP-2,3-diacylglucosamine hydrolase